jgi:transcriptional regulator with XRE-family HTH domain
MYSPAELGKLLKYHRTMHGLTQADIAAGVGFITPSLISKYEQGKRHPDRATALALARALDLPSSGTDDFLIAAGYAPINEGYRNISETLDGIRSRLDSIEKNLSKIISMVEGIEYYTFVA